MAKRNQHFLLPETPYRSYQDYLQDLGPFPKEKLNNPGAVLTEIAASGLRGRGGAGFPTGEKWRTIAAHPCKIHDIVCNAAEGEPGTFKDRFLIRYNPYPLIEGMIIAFHTIQARAAYIAIKGSFKKEIERLNQAIREMKQAGILKGIPFHIIEGPDEYLFGEEKALLNVIEKEGPFPRPVEEPPYEVGLFATPDCSNPALVNNAQTYSHVATILRFGSGSFRQLGTEDTPGTILFTLIGDIQKPGIYETEAGITIRTLLEKYGGGARSGRKYKAILPGVSTGVITAKQLDLPADFKTLKNNDSGLGSAGFIVMDDQISIPRVAQTVARFLYVESCNQCFACKAGLRRASQTLDALFAPAEDGSNSLEEIEIGAKSAPQGNRCYLPVQGAQLIPSLLAKFPKEFERQLSTRDSSPPVWPIPKIIDFDETKRIFILDERQNYKQPDWTYLEPETIE